MGYLWAVSWTFIVQIFFLTSVAPIYTQKTFETVTARQYLLVVREYLTKFPRFRYVSQESLVTARC